MNFKRFNIHIDESKDLRRAGNTASSVVARYVGRLTFVISLSKLIERVTVVFKV